ncbi:MAG: hypothetical protein JNK67_24935 [Alphaproteobacteria bacterium]|nr:hypothetical protein [Alphaproteobacteria bacterium]
MKRDWWSGALALAASTVLAGCVTLTSPGSAPSAPAASDSASSFPAPAAGGVATAISAPAAAGPIAHAGSEDPDPRYRSVLLNFTGGERVQLHYRLFEKAGRAAMCGYLTSDGGARDREVAGRWLQGATVLLGDQSFGDSSFLKLHGAQEAAARRPGAQCAASTLAWRPQFAGAPVAFRNGVARRAF